MELRPLRLSRSSQTDRSGSLTGLERGLHEATSRLRIGPAGGHADYGGNEIYRLDLLQDAPAWQLEVPPTGAIGNTGIVDDQLEDSNVYFDGRPRSTHTYDLVVARGDELWLVQPGAPFRSGGNGRGGLSGLMKLANRTWTNVAQGALAPGGPPAPYSAFHDERRDRIYTVHTGSGVLEYWDMATQRKGVTTAFTNISYLTRSIRVPELDLTVILNPNFPGHVGVFDNERHMSAFGEIPKPGATGQPPSYGGYNSGEFYPNGDWVPGWRGGVGAIFCWHGGNDVLGRTEAVDQARSAQGTVTVKPYRAVSQWSVRTRSR